MKFVKSLNIRLNIIFHQKSNVKTKKWEGRNIKLNLILFICPLLNICVTVSISTLATRH